MVANNFFGRSKSFAIISIRLELSSKPSSISVLVNENKATSAPEIRPEQIKSTNSNAKPVTTEKSIAINKLKKLAGSGSNYDSIS